MMVHLKWVLYLNYFVTLFGLSLNNARIMFVDNLELYFVYFENLFKIEESTFKCYDIWFLFIKCTITYNFKVIW